MLIQRLLQVENDYNSLCSSCHEIQLVVKPSYLRYNKIGPCKNLQTYYICRALFGASKDWTHSQYPVLDMALACSRALEMLHNKTNFALNKKTNSYHREKNISALDPRLFGKLSP